jgi:hypothetical protein
MSSKRPRRDSGARDIPTDTPPDTEAALVRVRQIMRQFSLDPAMLKDDDSEGPGLLLSFLGVRLCQEINVEYGTGVSFSKVTFDEVARLVELDPDKELTDIGTFEIHRSRIPTDLFKSIVTDMDIMLIQYGAPREHRTEEARSRFFSPVRIT